MNLFLIIVFSRLQMNACRKLVFENMMPMEEVSRKN